MLRSWIHCSIFLCLTIIAWSTQGFAETKNQNGKSLKQQPPQPAGSNAAPAKVNGNDTDDGYVAVSSTHIDFSETAIDGKMKAPDGFLLQSRQSSSLSQMVKLRSNFRNELTNSKSATKALVK